MYILMAKMYNEPLLYQLLLMNEINVNGFRLPMSMSPL